MSSSPYGAFQPIMDLAGKAKAKGMSILNGDAIREMLGMAPQHTMDETQPVSGMVPDPSWHDDMVRRANAGFAARAGQKPPMDKSTQR